MVPCKLDYVIRETFSRLKTPKRFTGTLRKSERVICRILKPNPFTLSTFYTGQQVQTYDQYINFYCTNIYKNTFIFPQTVLKWHICFSLFTLPLMKKYIMDSSKKKKQHNFQKHKICTNPKLLKYCL